MAKKIVRKKSNRTASKVKKETRTKTVEEITGRDKKAEKAAGD